MNTRQLIDILKPIPNFLGVYPCDLLPYRVPQTSGMVINTDPHDMSGEHWVAVHIKDGVGEYFDSYGRLPQVEIKRFLDRVCTVGWRYSHLKLQSLFSSVCGNYCLMFLIFRLLNLSYNDFINTFTPDSNVNDFIVEYLTTRSNK